MQCTSSSGTAVLLELRTKIGLVTKPTNRKEMEIEHYEI